MVKKKMIFEGNPFSKERMIGGAMTHLIILILII